MAKEILAIPEEDLLSVIAVIRMGLACTLDLEPKIPDRVRQNLSEWCDEEERYLREMKGDEE